MLALNKVMLIGSLPEEPKLVYAGNGTPQCTFTLVIEEKGQEHTFRLYVPVDVLGDRAENVAEAVSAGDTVMIDGTLRWRSWFDKKARRGEPRQARGARVGCGEGMNHGDASTVLARCATFPQISADMVSVWCGSRQGEPWGLIRRAAGGGVSEAYRCVRLTARL
jgi:primosomal replication protein N